MGFVDDALGTNIFGANATDRAIGAQTGAADRATQIQREMYNQSREDLSPWRDAGSSALSALMGELGLGDTYMPSNGGTVGHGAIYHGEGGRTPEQQHGDKYGSNYLPPGYQSKMGGPSVGMTGSYDQTVPRFSMDDFESDPGYQFRLAEGQKAIERSAAARGGLNSARTLKALQGYGQNLASNEYQNAYNRFYNQYDRGRDIKNERYNRLASLAGLGQTTSSNLAGTSTNFGNQLANTQIGLGNAIGAANIAGADRIAGLLGQASRAMGASPR